MKTFGLILFLFSSLSFAKTLQTFEKEVLLNEQEPVMEYQYVSSTCYRSESSCQEDQCTSCDVPYECGGMEWVRVGSKTIATVMVKIKITGTDGIDKLKILPFKSFDTGVQTINLFNALVSSDIAAPKFSYINDLKTDLKAGPSSEVKNIILEATLVTIDDSVIEKAFVDTSLDHRDFLKFTANFPEEMVMRICIDKDRYILRSHKIIGCKENIKMSEIKDLKFDLLPLKDYMNQVKWGKMVIFMEASFPKNIVGRNQSGHDLFINE